MTTVAATALGIAAAAYRGDGSAINTFLFMNREFSHVHAARIEGTAIVVMLLAIVAGTIWKRWPLFLPAAGYLLAESIARRHVRGQAFSDWALVTDAARYATPLAVMFLLIAVSRTGALRTAAVSAGHWTLRISVAAVFASHGAEALCGNATFVDLIITSAENLAGLRMTEAGAGTVLNLIGFADCALAAGTLLWAPPALLGWAACWGAITAFSRITAAGWGAYPDVLIRSSYFLAPIALALLTHATTETDAFTRASNSGDAAQPCAPDSSFVSKKARFSSKMMRHFAFQCEDVATPNGDGPLGISTFKDRCWLFDVRSPWSRSTPAQSQLRQSPS